MRSRWTMAVLAFCMAAILSACGELLDSPTGPLVSATGGPGGGGDGGTAPPTAPPKEKACRVTLTLVSIVAVKDNEPGTDGYRIKTVASIPPPKGGRAVVDVGVTDDELSRVVAINEVIGTATDRKTGFPPEATIEVEVRELDAYNPPAPGGGIILDGDDVGNADARVKLACPQTPPKELVLRVVDVNTQNRETGPFYSGVDPFEVYLKYRWEVVEVEVD